MTSFLVLLFGSPSCLFLKPEGCFCKVIPCPLVTVVADALGALLGEAKNIGLIGGLEASWEGEVVTHL